MALASGRISSRERQQVLGVMTRTGDLLHGVVFLARVWRSILPGNCSSCLNVGSEIILGAGARGCDCREGLYCGMHQAFEGSQTTNLQDKNSQKDASKSTNQTQGNPILLPWLPQESVQQFEQV